MSCTEKVHVCSEIDVKEGKECQIVICQDRKSLIYRLPPTPLRPRSKSKKNPFDPNMRKDQS